MVKTGTEKKPPAIPISSFDQSSQDAEAIKSRNEGATQALVTKHEEASNKIKNGIMESWER